MAASTTIMPPDTAEARRYNRIRRWLGVADFIVSTKDGPGWMTFNTVGFRKGGPVSFFGRMAIFNQQLRDDDDVTVSIFGSDAIGK